MKTFIVPHGLSEIDKMHLAEPTPAPKVARPKSSGEVTLEDRGVKWKELKSLSSRGWGCAFCKSTNATGQRRCGTCGSFIFQFGSLQFCYKTGDKKQLTSDQKSLLKEVVLNARSAAKQ